MPQDEWKNTLKEITHPPNLLSCDRESKDFSSSTKQEKRKDVVIAV